MLSGEATNTNFIVFGLILLGFKPTIYHTQGKHANHYTNNAVRPKKRGGLWRRDLIRGGTTVFKF